MAWKVGIVGAGVTPFKSRWVEKTYYELAQMATMEAMHDAGLEPKDVEAVFYGIYNDIFQRACIPESPLQGVIGLQNKYGIRISNGGATGAYTMSAAHASYLSGSYGGSSTGICASAAGIVASRRFSSALIASRSDPSAKPGSMAASTVLITP